MALMKPHVDGFEDEEDCEGHYDPDKVEERRCRPSSRNPLDPCVQCYQIWAKKEEAWRQQRYDAMTDEEKEWKAEFIKGLRNSL